MKSLPRFFLSLPPHFVLFYLKRCVINILFPLTLSIISRVEYLEKSKQLQEQLKELRSEIEVLKVGEKQTLYDQLHEEQLRSGDDKYSTLKKVTKSYHNSGTKPNWFTYINMILLLLFYPTFGFQLFQAVKLYQVTN